MGAAEISDLRESILNPPSPEELAAAKEEEQQVRKIEVFRL